MSEKRCKTENLHKTQKTTMIIKCKNVFYNFCKNYIDGI